MGSEEAVSVLIVDDHERFVDALEAILSTEKNIKVVGRAHNGADAARKAVELQPDVVLMDISMPVLDGFHASRIIKAESPDTCVLFVTGSAAASDFAQARAVGASGYLTKDRIATDLVDAVLRAAPPCAELS